MLADYDNENIEAITETIAKIIKLTKDKDFHRRELNDCIREDFPLVAKEEAKVIKRINEEIDCNYKIIGVLIVSNLCGKSPELWN